VSISKEPILKKETAVKPIYSITPFTMLDYPDHTACILWFAGCNMRCLYCYNPQIVQGKGKLTFKHALDFLATRKNLLDGVVLSGGECTLHKGILNLAKAIKKLGYLIKIDTNGSNPATIKKMIQEKLVDYIALDYKAPANSFSYVTQSALFDKFEQSLKFLISSSLPFEVRTTFHEKLMNLNDLKFMIKYLDEHQYSGNFYIQHFVNDTSSLGQLHNSYTRIDPSLLHTSGIEVRVRA
jgi:pyruvate formate lyase activating enzyme